MATDVQFLSKKQYYLLLGIIFFGMFIVAIPSMGAFYILGDLGGGVQTASYGVTFFLLGTILTKPVAVVVSKRIGKVRLLKISLFLTIVTFIPTMFVNNYNAYLVCRYINGICSGPIFFLVSNICISHRPKEKAIFFLALALIILTVAPVLSACYGAVIAYADYWRASFLMAYLAAVPLFILLMAYFKGFETETEYEPIDWIGIFTFGIGFTALGFCLITGQLIDGFRSLAFNIVLALGSGFFIFFLFWNTINPYPLMRFYLFKKIQFTIAIIHATFGYIFYYAITILLSYWLILYADYTVKWIAFTLSLSVAGPLALILVFRYRKIKGNLWIMTLAIGIFSLIALLTSHYNVEVNLFRIGIVKVIAGIAIAMHLPLILHNVHSIFSTEDFTYAWCFFIMFKLFGTLVGISYFATLWERRAAFYYWRLGGELTDFSENTLYVLNQLTQFHFTPLMKKEGLNHALNRQARALALDDCYFLVKWVAFGLAILTAVYAIIESRRKSQITLQSTQN